jgi:hypothetical protein
LSQWASTVLATEPSSMPAAAVPLFADTQTHRRTRFNPGLHALRLLR